MNRTNVSRTGFAQWRQQATQRRGLPLVSGAGASLAGPRTNSPRLPAIGLAGPARGNPTIRIGEFVISPEGDPQILGHPQIRY